MKETLSDRVRLGVFEIDLRAGELRQGEGAVLILPDQPLQILRMLIEASGEIVTREEIRQRLWPDDTVVEFDHSINTAIKKLRRALVDSGDEPHYIGTIAKRGYRLLVPVERVGAEDSDGSGRTAGPSTRAEALGRDDTPGSGVAAGAASAATQLARDIAAQRTAAGRWSRRTWLAATVVVCAGATAGTLYWRAHRAPKLTERDTIVLADFDNKTGEPVFDDTLKQALTIQLEQSPFLNVLSNGKVRQTLKLMNRTPKDPMTEDVTREVCIRSGSKAMVLGSIAALGREYVIGLRAVDCNLGDSLGEVQERATGKEAVLNALDRAITSVRSKLGESLGSVEKYTTPLAEATTPSLEALKAYSAGLKIQRAEGPTAGLPFLKRAVELDPNFAMAYRDLWVFYDNLNEGAPAEENARKAFQLRSNLSERERLLIEGAYYEGVTGELEKAARSYEMLQQSYPRDVAGVGNLGVVYCQLGNLEKYLEQSRTVTRLQPDAYAAYANAAAAYLTLNRLDEAEEALKQAEQHGLTAEALLVNQYLLAFLKGDQLNMAKSAAAAVGKPGTEDLMLAWQGESEAWYGRLRSARNLTQRALDSAQRNDAKDSAAGYAAAAALREVAAGNRQQARADTQEALKLSQSQNVKAISAIALAQAGDVAAAEKLAAELDKSYPMHTIVQRYWLPSIRAAVALQQKNPTNAVELLHGMGTLELVGIIDSIVSLCPVYVRGQAYLMLHDSKAAAAEFQKFIDHYGLVGNFSWGALARLQLARAYALEAQTDPGDREKARTAYQNFLTIWKDADPDVPIYKQAKAEYARISRQ